MKELALGALQLQASAWACNCRTCCHNTAQAIGVHVVNVFVVCVCFKALHSSVVTRDCNLQGHITRSLLTPT
jgi:hypothetical protein